MLMKFAFLKSSWKIVWNIHHPAKSDEIFLKVGTPIIHTFVIWLMYRICECKALNTIMQSKIINLSIKLAKWFIIDLCKEGLSCRQYVTPKNAIAIHTFIKPILFQYFWFYVDYELVTYKKDWFFYINTVLKISKKSI